MKGKDIMRKLGKSRIAAVLAAMVMMTGCGGSQGNSTASISPDPNNLAGSNKTEKTKVEYVNRQDESGEKPGDKECAYYSDYKDMDKAALKMLGKCVEGNPGENILISPFSIEMAFGMVENGADGNTLSEMEKVIGGGVGIQDMNRDLRYISSRMEEDQDVSWNVANSIWLNTEGGNQIKLGDDYLNTVSSYYNPEIRGLEFNDEAVKQINGWVNEETRSMIPEIIGEPPQGKMMLINAVAFEGEWNEAFSDNDICEDFDFTNADGSTASITMLYGEGNKYYTFGDGEGFKVTNAPRLWYGDIVRHDCVDAA